MKRQGILRDNAQRCPGPLDLRTPLLGGWAAESRARPVIGQRRIYVKGADLRTVALDAVTGAHVWVSRGRAHVTPLLLFAEGLLTMQFNTSRFQVLNESSGEVIRELQDKAVAGSTAVVDGVLVQQGSWVFGATVIATGKVAWRKDLPQAGPAYEGLFCASLDRVIAGLDGGPVVAYSLADGSELWRTTVGDLSWRRGSEVRPASVHGPLVLYKDTVIMEVFDGHLVGHSAKDGRRLWHVDCGAVQGCLYGDRYYRISTRGYQIVDPKSGRVLLEKPFQMPPELKRAGVSPWSLLVSETHVFTASQAGYVVAFERETGKYAWSVKPKGTAGGANLWAEDGRLYVDDLSRRVYCFEEASQTGRARPARGGPVRGATRSGKRVRTPRRIG